MSRKTIAILVLSAIIAIGGSLGIFAAMGACTALWVRECIEPILGSTRDRSHPASWVFPCLFVPGMVVGIAGSLMVIFWPMCRLFPGLLTALNECWHMAWLRRERRVARAWLRHLESEIERLGEKKQPLGIEL